MEKSLTNQDYVNMIFLAIKAGDVGCYTTSDLMNKYCLSNTEKLERGDKSKIKKLVFETLTSLLKAGYLSLNDTIYRKEKDMSQIEITFEDDKLLLTKKEKELGEE